MFISQQAALWLRCARLHMRIFASPILLWQTSTYLQSYNKKSIILSHLHFLFSQPRFFASQAEPTASLSWVVSSYKCSEKAAGLL